MVLLLHNTRQVIQIQQDGAVVAYAISNEPIVKALIKTAQDFPNELIVWCHVDMQSYLNVALLDSIFHHQKIMASYDPSEGYFPSMIGYVEDSPFINLHKKVTYPTWQMSGWVGGVHASVINALAPELSSTSDFTYFLSSLAKMAMPLGLLCYSDPKLLRENVSITTERASISTVYKFVKQHYKTRWSWLLLFNRIWYEKKWDLLPFLKALSYRRKSVSSHCLAGIEVNSSRQSITDNSIDVIIPTIGRKAYVYQVLKDLAQQTHLPKQVIIVEQNPEMHSSSELEYLTTEEWPFKIVHRFIHQTGACNARNIALQQLTADWVFLADDDNRMDKEVLEKIIKLSQQYGVEVLTTKYIQQGESTSSNMISSWPTFGAGNSFVRTDLLKHVSFNTVFEFGYGEDADFGMQLRNLGQDILYVPNPSITHLKAPVGGFRTPYKWAWSVEEVQPKPSPTVLLYKLLHQTKEQLLGYKTTLLLKYYSKQSIKNPVKYYHYFQKQWNRSVYWANRILEQNIQLK